MANWKKKVVVVTGGSRGFGKSIVRAFAERGALSVIAARNEAFSDQVASEFRSEGLNVESIQMDVLERANVERAVATLVEQYGAIDAWVNNVGQSTRVNLMDATEKDYRESLESNFFSAVRCCDCVLPHLSRSSGFLVNIGSLAAKTPWRLVAPYTVGKHALAAYTGQLRLEGPSNVHYLFVCPGPIARETDEGDRYSTEGMSEAAKKPGAGAPVKAIDPDRLAGWIVRACEKRKLELVVPGKSRLLFAITQLFPNAGYWILDRKSRG